MEHMKITGPELSNLLTKYQRDAMEFALRSNPRTDLLISTCGLSGEFGEFLGALTPEEDTSERADVVWYAGSILDLVGIDMGADRFIREIKPHPEFFQFADQAERGPHYAGGVPAFMSVFRAIGVVSEFAKKVGGHGREKDLKPVVEALGHVVWYILHSETGTEIAEMLAGNIAKLRGRHGEKKGAFDPNYGLPGPIRFMPIKFTLPLELTSVVIDGVIVEPKK